jgi:hypothetical protein
MRMPCLADLAQGIPGGIPIPIPPPTFSVISVSAYVGGKPVPGREGLWEGHEPLKGAVVTVTVPLPLKNIAKMPDPTVEGDDGPMVVTATTPASGFVNVPIPVPVGTYVEITVQHAGQTQRRTMGTTAAGSGIMAEFHFAAAAPGIPVVAIVVPAVIVVGILGYLLWPKS